LLRRHLLDRYEEPAQGFAAALTPAKQYMSWAAAFCSALEG
jgi:hypothetical protein